jgi:hypothetical protein
VAATDLRAIVTLTKTASDGLSLLITLLSYQDSSHRDGCGGGHLKPYLCSSKYSYGVGGQRRALLAVAADMLERPN